MEDDLEEAVLKQACVSQMKVLSKFTFNAVGFFNRPGTNSSVTYFLKLLLRPEVFLIAIIIFVFCFYLQALELNANGFINRISNKLRFKSKSKISFAVSSIAEKDSWEEIKTQSAVYAVQGRRPKMEDRSVVQPLSAPYPPHTLGVSPRKICFSFFCGRNLIDSKNSRARADFFFLLRENGEEASRY
jgi:protein phosphatase 1L